jgi:16S rRNA (guanine527-N7)-methyltransferase
MDTARIAELLEPFLREPVDLPGPPEPARANAAPAVLSPVQLKYISTYIDILVRWNARINLTAIRDPEDIVTRHFGESLFAARHLFPAGGAASGRAALQGSINGQEGMGPSSPEGPTVADIGSGAGFPGLPLKLWSPDISLTLIESNHKKAAFLREVARALTLTDVNIQNTRAEILTGTVFNTVTLRAVERFDAILPTAAGLVAPSGRLAVLISSAQQDQACLTLPDLTWSSPAPIPHSRSRILLIGCKQ